jgi:hypothetical protein
MNDGLKGGDFIDNRPKPVIIWTSNPLKDRSPIHFRVKEQQAISEIGQDEP